MSVAGAEKNASRTSISIEGLLSSVRSGRWKRSAVFPTAAELMPRGWRAGYIGFMRLNTQGKKVNECLIWF